MSDLGDQTIIESRRISGSDPGVDLGSYDRLYMSMVYEATQRVKRRQDAALAERIRERGPGPIYIN